MTGFLFEQKNREQLIERIRMFMKMSNEERRKMGLAGRKKMERELRQIVIHSYMEQIEQ